MKSVIKKILQAVLGFQNYLFIFSLYIIKTLKWNKKEGDFIHFLNHIPDGGIVLDIGANIGVMTVFLAQKLKNSRVHAFEPIPNNLKTLQRIVRYFHLNNVTIHDFALGNEKGHIEMVMPIVKSVKMQGLSHIIHDSIDSFNEGEKFTVDVKKLDDIPELNTSDSKIHAIKMDVENFEYFVLKGGENLIKKHKPIIYTELWDNENRENCFNFILEMDYKIQVFVNNNLVDFDPSLHTTQNFFFIQDSKTL